MSDIPHPNTLTFCPAGWLILTTIDGQEWMVRAKDIRVVRTIERNYDWITYVDTKVGEDALVRDNANDVAMRLALALEGR